MGNCHHYCCRCDPVLRTKETRQEKMIGSIISLLISIAWAYMLFRIGMKKKNTTLFYVLLYAPMVLPLLISVVIFTSVFTSIVNVFGAWALILLITLAFERVAWGITLREISGNDELVWFYVVYYIPLFGWLLYRLTKIR